MTDLSDAPTAPRTERRDSKNIAAAPNFDLLAGVSLRVSVEVGSTSMTLAELLAIDEGSVIELDRAQPGIFAEKYLLMVPGLNHGGLADEIAKHSPAIRYADPFLFFNLPDFPGVGSKQSLEQVAAPTLDNYHICRSSSYMRAQANRTRIARNRRSTTPMYWWATLARFGGTRRAS